MASTKEPYSIRAILLVLLLVCCSGQVALSQATDKDAAEAAASMFLSNLDTGDLNNLYEQMAGPTLRQQISEEIFKENSGIRRIQFGGPATARTLVGSQDFSQNALGQTGTFYYIRYKATYPNGSVFEDVSLEKVDGNWKVGAIATYPAPSP